MTTTTVDPSVLVVGYGLRSSAEFDACPPGTVVRYPGVSGDQVYVKEPTGDLWRRTDNGNGSLYNSRDHFLKNGQNVIAELPNVLRVGDAIPPARSEATRGEAFAALPIGTTVRCHTDPPKTLTKIGEDQWQEDRRPSRIRRDRWFAARDHRHTIEALPDGVLSVNSLASQAIESVEELAGLAVGTAITTESEGRKTTWTVAEGGRLELNDGGATLPVEHFTASIKAGLCYIGVKPEVGQVYRDGSYYRLLVTKDEDGWYMATFYTDAWNSVEVHHDIPGTLAAPPDWMTNSLRGVAQAAVSYFRDNSTAVAEITELREKVAGFETKGLALRDAFAKIERGKVSSEELRSFIDSVLSENGIKPLDVTVTVTVNATVSKYVTIPGSTLAEFGGITVLEDKAIADCRALGYFPVVFEEEAVVEPGECGCPKVGNRHLQTWVRNNVADYYGYAIDTKKCSSENCRNAPA